MSKDKEQKQQLQPPQRQKRQPGIESEMRPRPRAEDHKYRGSGKLRDKVALITGGDSGIGRAVAICYAKEGADVSVVYFNFLTKAALKSLKEGGAIINTTSVTAYRGSPKLLDYSATKGAIVAFTRSLSQSLVEKGIRVNGVAPGPIWTPLIPASFDEDKVVTFGSGAPTKRPGQPEEVAPCYVFLASDDSSYMTGQILHPNGGEVING